MPSLRLAASYDPHLSELLSRFGEELVHSATTLRELLVAYPDRAELAGRLVSAEHRADDLTHDIIHRLRGGECGPAPFDAGDGLRLATALDDIVDHIEQAADMLGLYAVEAPMEQATALAGILVLTTQEIAAALGALVVDGDPASHLERLHRLENDGDRISRAAVAGLFASGIDPLVVIRWKDIFNVLETAIDACDAVGHLIEGISLRIAGADR